VFRRRRREDADRSGPQQAVTQDDAGAHDDAGAGDDPELAGTAEPDDDPEPDDELTGAGAAEVGRTRRTAGQRRGRRRRTGEPATGEPGTAQDGGAAAAGPFDGAGSYPARERMDFGSLLVPPREGVDIQINMAEDQGVWIAIVRGDSALQLQAFAAPKTSGLWDEVRQEIAEEVAKSGGDSAEGQGSFGTELLARINPADPGQRRQQLQQVRFLGVDGPRWFLRGLISGPAAHRPELATPFEEIFADVVVVRGDHPAPPRDLLEIRLPEDARRALEEQMAQAAENPEHPNPFERGPEITETR
jgi:hypothetical protein